VSNNKIHSNNQSCIFSQTINLRTKIILEYLSMSIKPTYEELEQRVKALELDTLIPKQAEYALKESEFFFSHMFEQSTTSTCLYNPEGIITKVNNEFCKMFGVEEKMITNGNYNVFEDQAAIDAGIIPLLKEIFDKRKRNKWDINYDIEVASESTGMPTSKKTRIFLEVFGYPLLDSEGHLKYVVLQHYGVGNK
jgi:PAS domain S-box-containing protein